MTPLIQLTDISKRFGRIQANNKVSLSVQEGCIHGIVGGNGAGKSTIMKILYGLYQPDEGEIFLRGRRVRIPHPMAAIELGMGMVPQDFLLIESMNAVENIILGAEPHHRGVIDYESAESKIKGMADKFHLECELDRPVSEMPVGVRQRLEILKLLYRDASIVILDEPTGPLVPHEVEDLFLILRQLRKSGATIIFVSHKLQEIMTICDRISVMREGQLIITEEKKNVSVDELVMLMTGEKLPQLKKTAVPVKRNIVLDMKNVYLKDKGRNVLSDISLSVMEGEILGIAGVEGNGQHELEEVLMGLKHPVSRSLRINNNPVQETSPADMLGKGLGFIPSQRHLYGMIGDFSLAENLMLNDNANAKYNRYGLLNWNDIKENAAQILNKFHVNPADPASMAKWLSGGNQQKLVIAGILSRNPGCLVASHPTRGISIHDAHFVWQKFLDLKEMGCGIILITADMTELFALSDRIAVLFKGEIVTIVPSNEITPGRLGAYMTGANNRGDQNSDVEA